MNELYFSIVDIGAQIGNVLVLSMGGLMCSQPFVGGWPLIFYSTSKSFSKKQFLFS